MQIVVSRKITAANADKALDLTALAVALLLPGSGVTVKSFATPEAVKSYIDEHTAKGYVCHRFDFVASYKSEASTGIYTPATAAPGAPLRAVK